MPELRYTREHEWVRVEDGVGTCGITDYAQSQLGDVVFVELPPAGKKVVRGGEAAVVESVKAASEVYAPVSGEVFESNAGLPDNPAQVNQSPMGDGWFMRIRLSNPAELGELMDEAAYKAYLATLS